MKNINKKDQALRKIILRFDHFDVTIITTAQLHFSAGSNPAHGLFNVYDADDLR